MLRRSHKKSRGGCVQCKRRHVKCDEGRPACRLCTHSGQRCSFTSQRHVLSHPANAQQSLSPADCSSRDASESDGISPAAGSQYTSASPSQLGLNDLSTMDLPSGLNLEHMELIIHLISNRSMFNLGHTEGPYHPLISFALQTGLQAPYLLHQLLAFSARHLAFLHPTRSEIYLRHAFNLHQEAVSQFNSTFTTTIVDKSNCAAILLFSSILGHHQLADTLSKREPGGLDGFLSHYIHCIEMHRGIFTIAIEAWPLLMETELQYVLVSSADFTSQEPRGRQCGQIKSLVGEADALTNEEKDACSMALDYLQVGFDALEVIHDEDQAEPGRRYQMLCSWTMLISPEFKRLLAKKRPEALAVLGYYTLLLHYGRDMWQVRDAGRYIFGIIVDYLGVEWDPWLSYVRAKMDED